MTVNSPDSRLCIAAAAFAKRVSTPCLFNHVARTFAFGEAAGDAQKLKYDRELFYIAAILHDLGLSSLARGAGRFEIEGADAAKEFLSREGMNDRDIDVVWDAIALHTTAGVPLRKRVEMKLVQIGAGIDLGFAPLDIIATPRLTRIIEEWPRLNFKVEFPALFLALFEKNPHAAASHVTAEICERHVPGFRRMHVCDVIEGSMFSE
jgi:hypothetical protein